MCYNIIIRNINIIKSEIKQAKDRREYRKGKQEYNVTQGTDKGDWDCKECIDT